MGIKTEDTLDQAVTIKMNSLGWLHLWLLQLLFVSKSSLCNPVDCSPPGSSVRGVSLDNNASRLPSPSPGDLPGFTSTTY